MFLRDIFVSFEQYICIGWERGVTLTEIAQRICCLIVLPLSKRLVAGYLQRVLRVNIKGWFCNPSII